VELSAQQQQVVAHAGGRLRVTGPAATGKTTALRARYLNLVASSSASRVLVVCRDRAAALAFRDAILVELRGGFDSLPITTVHGVAHDLADRAGDERRLLGHAEQWALVERTLASEEIDADVLWPSLWRYVGRRAFVDEVARAVLTWRETAPDGRVPADARWAEVAQFEARYQAQLDDLGATDSPGLLTRAGEIVESEGFDRFDHVLVDDGHDLSAVAARLVAALGDRAASAVVTADPDVSTRPDLDAAACLCLAAPDPADEVELTQTFTGPPSEEAMVARHPSVEPEAIAAVLLESDAEGVPWDDMAVLVRSPGQRSRALHRALTRHGIPVAGDRMRPGDEPVVRGIVDFLRWTAGDPLALSRVLSSPLSEIDAVAVRGIERRALAAEQPLEEQPELAPLRALRDELQAVSGSWAPSRLAHLVYRRLLGQLVADPDAEPGTREVDADRALDAVVALIDGLSRWEHRPAGARLDDYLAALDASEAEPDSWRTSSGRQGGVTLTSIQAATGRRWHTVVVAGCLEGELPRVSGFVPFFDPLLLTAVGGGAVPTVAERRDRSLVIERRRFHLARTRATHRLVASAGPEAKDIVSRFVESWPRRIASLPPRPFHPYPPLAPTQSEVAVFPDGVLVLSASQLNTYADCPLKYAYSYGLRVRDDGNVWADFGTLVHDILERFLAPGNEIPHSLEALQDLAGECWSDDVAPYRPQREQLRRELSEMLVKWWEEEGQHLDRSAVVAVEHDFNIEVGSHRVVGKIDRVDRTSDGSIEIVDYKTGKRQVSEKDIADDLQLATYHLAATRDPALMEHGAPSRLRLLYTRSMVSREQPITADHAARTEARIIATADEILGEDFGPSIHADCDHCDFHRLCPLQAEGREVGAR
jgi:superfamily I DNA/RNA helicase/RecB family exonuclease